MNCKVLYNARCYAERDSRHAHESTDSYNQWSIDTPIGSRIVNAGPQCSVAVLLHVHPFAKLGKWQSLPVLRGDSKCVFSMFFSYPSCKDALNRCVRLCFGWVETCWNKQNGYTWHVVARRGAHVGSRGAAERSRGSCQSGAKHVDSRHSAEPWRGSNHPFGKYLAILQVSAIKYPWYNWY